MVIGDEARDLTCKESRDRVERIAKGKIEVESHVGEASRSMLISRPSLIIKARQARCCPPALSPASTC